MNRTMNKIGGVLLTALPSLFLLLGTQTVQNQPAAVLDAGVVMNAVLVQILFIALFAVYVYD